MIGHDGGTIGQTARLRVAPEAGVAVCVLTNASNSESLTQALFTEVFEEFAGIAPPPPPQPTAEPVDLDPLRHTGRYERPAHRFDVPVRDRHVHVVSTLTGALGELVDAPAEEITLYPADATGDHFVGRVSPLAG